MIKKTSELKPKYKLMCGNALDSLKEFEDNTFHMAVTSPPYWDQRQYLFSGAVVLNNNLSESEKEKIEKELEEYGIKPKIQE
jgi:DNA modification methylase